MKTRLFCFFQNLQILITGWWRLVFLLLLVNLYSPLLFAQGKQWDKTLGGNNSDQLSTLITTADGGYLLGGSSESNKSGDKTEDRKGVGTDYWVVKLKADGSKAWDKTIGGNYYDNLTTMQQTSDGGYILGGWSYSDKSGDKTENNKQTLYLSPDYWVVKLKADGTIIWDKTIGGNGGDELRTLQQTSDGGYILGGISNSGQSGDKSEDPKADGYSDYWLVKLKADGSKVWDKTIGGNASEDLQALQQTNDGGYILGGFSASNKNGDKSENNKGADDYWVVKLRADGSKVWDKTLGGDGYDQLMSLQQANDGGYILGGHSNSGKSGDKTEDSKGAVGDYDYWLVKIKADGSKVWDNTIGGSDNEALRTVEQTPDGGYLLAGTSNSGKGGDKSGDNKGYNNYWVVKVEANGAKAWDQTFGGSNNNVLQAMQQTPDGGYILGGYSDSPIHGDKTEGSKGVDDYWVIKVKESGTKAQIITFDPILNKTLQDSPFSLSARASSGLPVTFSVVSGPATVQDSTVTLTGLGMVTIKATQAGDATYISAPDVIRTFLVEGETPISKQWDKTIGGDRRDMLTEMIISPDGGYLLGGSSASGVGGDKSEPKKSECPDNWWDPPCFDYWVVKVNAAGSKQWDKSFGGSGDNNLSAIISTADGGYLLGGTSSSNMGGDKSEDSRGSGDYWVVKIDKNGTQLWDKTFGGSGYDGLATIVPTADGGYLLGGYSYSSNDGDKSEANRGRADYWVIKIDSNGKKLWDKAYGGTEDELFSALVVAADGNYLLGGSSLSGVGGDKTQARKGDYDYWLVKIDTNSKKIWDKTLGGDLKDQLTTLIATPDEGYLLGGWSESDIGEDKSEASRGGRDYWIVKTDAQGNKAWDKRFGGSDRDELEALVVAGDGNYLLGGRSLSEKTGDKSQVSRGAYDYWLVKTDTNGNKLWDRTMGGNSSDFLYTLLTTTDGSYLLGGWSQSDRVGDKSEASKGELDFWIVKVQDTSKKEQTITFDPVLNKTLGEKPFVLSAQSTSKLPVSFSVVSGPATVSGNTVTLTGLGIVTLKAAQAGNASYLATEATQTFLVEAATPVTKLWDKAFGGNFSERLTNIIPTPDGGYLLSGSSYSGKTGDKTEPSKGGADYWVVKINNNGTQLWDKTFGGTGDDELTDVVATPDGGYLLGGSSISGSGGDKTEASKGNGDYWVVKIDANGMKQWDRTFGGSEYDFFRTLVTTPDGGYLLGGYSESGISGDKSPANTGLWLIKIDAKGNKIWDKSPDYAIDPQDMVGAPDGGYLLAGINYSLLKLNADGEQEWNKSFTGGEFLRSLIVTPDGGYLLGGFSQSDKVGDKSEVGRGNYDYWVVKVNRNGVKEWDKTIGGAGRDELFSLLAAPDGGYLLGGFSASGISGEKSQVRRGFCESEDCGPDYWVVKLSSSGQKVWDKTIGGTAFSVLEEKLTAMVTTPDSGYLLAGYSNSDRGGDKSAASRGNTDFWVVKIKEEQPLTTQWDMRYGGAGNDNFTVAIKTFDGGYLSGGYSTSGTSGDKSQGSQGQTDYWIVKSDKDGKKLWEKRYGGAADDYLNRVIQTQDGSYLLGGSSLSGKSGDKTETSQGDRDYWVVKVDKQGTKQWDRTYGGSGSDELKKVIQLASGEYVLGGYSNSPVSGDKSQNSQGGNDYWLVKISSSGTKIWDGRYGGSQEETLGSFTETREGGFFLGGSSWSGQSGDKSQASQGGSDYWAVKTDKDGNLLWEKSFGGSGADEVYSVRRSHGDNLYLAGTSSSGKEGDKSQKSQGGKDYWLIKLDEKGSKLWDRTFGGSEDDELRASTYTDEGHYFLAGHSYSGVSGDKSQASQGASDYWVVQVAASGEKIADQRFGGSGAEELRTVFQTNDGGLLLGGRSDSGVSGDRTQPSQGSTDYWLVKVAPVTSAIIAARQASPVMESVALAEVSPLTIYPNPVQEKATVSFTVPQTQYVQLKMYDSQGKEMSTLFQGKAQAQQTYQLEWQANNKAAGMYLLQLQTPTKRHQQKLLLTR